MNGTVRLMYRLGWVFFAGALLYRVSMIFQFGYSVYYATSVLPRNLMEMSFLSFLVAIATESYARASSK